MNIKWTAVRLAAVALLVGIAVGIMVPKIFAADAPSAQLQKVHVVAVGESLWGLARRSGAQKDPRRFIYEVQVLNGLSGAGLTPGQKLIIPR